MQTLPVFEPTCANAWWAHMHHFPSGRPNVCDYLRKKEAGNIIEWICHFTNAAVHLFVHIFHACGPKSGL